jgi:hypothetical protein
VANDWVDGSDLASMSRGGNILQRMGYDPDEVRMNPSLRQEIMGKLAGPLNAMPPQVAQAAPPPPIPSPNPRSQNGNSIDQPPGQPRLFNRDQPSALPPPATLNGPTQASVAGPPTSSSVSPSGTASNAPDIQNARAAAGSLLAPEPAAPDTSAQDTMIANQSVPLNPNDPMYKVGTGGKFLRGLEAAGVGFLKGGVPGSVGGVAEPAAVGATPYGAPTQDYQIDDATRQAKLALAQKQKADALAKFKQMTDLRTQSNTGAKDAGTISVDLAKLPNETTTANADMLRAQDAGNPKNEMEAIAAYGRETDPAKKAALWDTVTKMHEAAIAEKPPKAPGDHPSAQLAEYGDWKAAFTRDNRRPPTADEIQEFTRRSIDPNAPDEVSSIVGQAMDTKQKFADSATRDPDDGSYMWGGKVHTAQEFQDMIDKLGRTDPNVKLAKKGYQIDETGQVVKTTHGSAPPTPLPPVGPKNKEIWGQNGEHYRSDGKTWQKVP